MTRPANLVGQRFSRLVVVKRDGSDKWGSATWMCKCDCGNETVIRTTTLRNGGAQSCGCLNLEKAISRCPDNARHKLSRTRLYRVWAGMKSRCYNKNHKDYASYGGRGIKLCDEWLVSDNFFEWALKNGYSDDLTIDRIDVNGEYEPSNCRWANTIQQMRNRTITIKVLFDGEEVTLQELSERYNIPYATLYWRYKNNFSQERLIESVKSHKSYEKRKE